MKKNKQKYPDYMRTSVTPQFLAKNPIYKDLFHKCPNCGNYSLKPVGMDHIKDISKTKDANVRRCGICSYTHVNDLVVDSSTSARAPINVTESIDAIKKGRILL